MQEFDALLHANTWTCVSFVSSPIPRIGVLEKKSCKKVCRKRYKFLMTLRSILWSQCPQLLTLQRDCSQAKNWHVLQRKLDITKLWKFSIQEPKKTTPSVLIRIRSSLWFLRKHAEAQSSTTYCVRKQQHHPIFGSKNSDQVESSHDIYTLTFDSHTQPNFLPIFFGKFRTNFRITELHPEISEWLEWAEMDTFLGFEYLVGLL